MNFTYKSSLTNYDYAIAPSNRAALKKAYEKWRWASNYLCHQILEDAYNANGPVGSRYSVAHGTTSTSEKVADLYPKLKNLGYKIVLLLCYSQDEVRKQLIERRENEQAFVQVDPNEVKSKGDDFPKRFDIYFDAATEISFYWNADLKHGMLPKPCAKWVAETSKLEVLDEAGWRSFCSQYLHDVNKLKISPCKKFVDLVPKDLLDAQKSASTGLQTFGLLANTSTGSNTQQEPKSEVLGTSLR
ncbi:MAG TPA: hypothetical protein VHA13_03070 [Gammaproteobacteria bacterium]|nr:hypothetical protein [Gammaproteobacteria bacterium]